MFLRNQFKGDGVFEIPKIKKEEIKLYNIELTGYDKLNEKETDKIVHFFLDDYKFEAIWNDPEPRVEKLKKFKAVLAPNYSTQNILYKTLYSKTAYGHVDNPNKGMGAAGTRNPIKFPGWDPSIKPGDNYEWRGKGDPTSGKGAWVNTQTKETLHPDLNHGDPHGPHWDYNYPGAGNGFRIYPDGHMSPKEFEGGMHFA